MKINMKKLAAWMLALLLVFHLIPAVGAETQYTSGILKNNSEYRDKLEIDGPKALRVGEEFELTVKSEGYKNLQWTSSNSDVASVEAGVVTGIGVGTAKITAKEDSESDSIIIKVLEALVDEENEEKNDETAEMAETVETAETAKSMVVIISGNKDKLTYDGNEHQYSGYNVFCNDSGFDESKLHLVNEERLISAKECGIYKVKFEAGDFEYDDSDVNIVYDVNDGWMQIKPAEVTVKADDKVKISDANPIFTATVTGMINEEDPSLIQYEFEVSGQSIIPYGEEIQSNYKVKYLAGSLTSGTSYTLYNIAEVGTNAWARLRRTTIRTEKKLEDYLKGKKKNDNVDIPTSEYYAEPYDFTDEILTYNNKTYAHISRADDGLDVQGYYVATLKDTQQMVAVKGKVGGGKGCITSDKYTEEGIDSFHCNYLVTFIDNPANFKTQDVYNMVSVNNSPDYYRLKRTTILAKPAEELKIGATLSGSEYVLDRYDFSNVTINIDGETYKYSATKPTGLYDSCYTIQFENVKYQERINGNDNWYNNDDGWLDGSRYQYGDYGEDLPRTTVGFHANYKATTYKGTKPPKSVKIHSTWPSDKPAFEGTQITMKGEVSGFDQGYTLQWQYSEDQLKWIDIDGANELEYTYTLNKETEKLYWRLVATDKE